MHFRDELYWEQLIEGADATQGTNFHDPTFLIGMFEEINPQSNVES